MSSAMMIMKLGGLFAPLIFEVAGERVTAQPVREASRTVARAILAADFIISVRIIRIMLRSCAAACPLTPPAICSTLLF